MSAADTVFLDANVLVYARDRNEPAESLIMGPTQDLVDEIYQDRVLRARATPPEEKLLAGARLFEEVCERMAAGLRDENPDADESTIQELLRRRLDLLRRVRSSR
jgi:hypothetical protein